MCHIHTHSLTHTCALPIHILSNMRAHTHTHAHIHRNKITLEITWRLRHPLRVNNPFFVVLTTYQIQPLTIFRRCICQIFGDSLTHTNERTNSHICLMCMLQHCLLLQHAQNAPETICRQRDISIYIHNLSITESGSE